MDPESYYALLLVETRSKVVIEYETLRTLDATNTLLNLVEIDENKMHFTHTFHEKYHLEVRGKLKMEAVQDVINALSLYYNDLRTAKKQKLN